MTPEEIAALGTEQIPVPFLEISHSAKIGTVAGTIDLGKLTNPSRPEAALLPGIIPQAHRGIVFVDEINRLADTSPEITDVLLDAMGTKPGRVQIEETGLPVVEVPVAVSVWAASNPDEEPGPLAEIRRQLSDRFDLVIPMGRPTTPEEVVDILT
ncbi:MAG: magnesium chelatase subunit, partial [Thermacetogenium sp.]|nr:magnesium chelatase subunit [Thermacetogenium sp.]